jgi:hypothetical protein
MIEACMETVGLGLRTRQGWVFRDVDLTPPARWPVAGSAGASAVVLVLAGFWWLRWR